MIVKLGHPIVGYKKVRRGVGQRGFEVVTLVIPAGALINIPAETLKHKYRASSAYVAAGSGRSYRNLAFIYTLGEVVRPRFGFDNYDAICASGIHFFLSPDEAKNYNWS